MLQLGSQSSRVFRPALLSDLGCLRVHSHAVLERLAQLDPRRSQTRVILIVCNESALNEAFADIAIFRQQRNPLINPVKDLEQGEIFEGNRVHATKSAGRYGLACFDRVVPETGVEPATYALRMRRSTN
jgi:hypothetical protein